MNLSVHHVAVIVSDYAAAKHFYVDLLGLPVVRENCRGNGLWKLDLRLGDGELEIFNATSRPRGVVPGGRGSAPSGFPCGQRG